MMNPTAIDRGMNLVDRVVDHIGREIVSDKYTAEDNLPNEVEWCKQLNVSRSVLREALRVLVSKNLIAIRARLGGRVRNRADWNMLDPDVLLWLSQDEDNSAFVGQLFELRRIVEPSAAELAATRIQSLQLEQLRQACRGMEAAGEDPELFIIPDSLFHRALFVAVGNPLFQGLGQAVMVALDMTLRLSLDVPRGLQQSVPLHWAVVNEIARHDSAAARKAMLRVVDESARDVAEAQASRARTLPKK